MTVKLSIIYYSMTGTNTQMSRWAAEAAEKFGAEIRLRQVQEIVPMSVIEKNPIWLKNVESTKDIPTAIGDDVEWADAIIFASPSRFGVMASQLKQFIDGLGGLWAQGKTVNKFVTAMTSAQNSHGGQERTIDSIYTVMQHWGSIIVSSGFILPSNIANGGNPYGISVTLDSKNQIPNSDVTKQAVVDQTNRLLQIAQTYQNGLSK